MIAKMVWNIKQKEDTYQYPQCIFSTTDIENYIGFLSLLGNIRDYKNYEIYGKNVEMF